MTDTTTQMPEEDYQRLLVAAAALGESEPDLDGQSMFVRLGLLDADRLADPNRSGGFLLDVINRVGNGKRAFAIRRAFMNSTV